MLHVEILHSQDVTIMANRDNLNRKETETTPFPEIQVVVREIRPFRKWLEGLWAVLSDPRTAVTASIAVIIRVFLR
jgi:hypothetical protein